MMPLASLVPLAPLSSHLKTRPSLGPLPKSLLQLIIQRAAETQVVPTPVLTP